jgi:molybdopterin synthase catalytic subunit
VALTGAPLPVEVASGWVSRPDCGAVVVFAGTVRDHAEGRPGVSELTYEAYTEQVEPRLAALAAELRQQWSTVGRVILWHRVGSLHVGDCSVIVAVSAPHRDEAFEAARWGIDTLKATVPIWKQETWDGGEDWGRGARPVAEVRG